jgi:hypothetical protein
MPILIPLRARRVLVYDGRTIPAGTVFHTSALAAAALTYQHDAEFLTPDQDSAQPSRKKRTYKRRDLQPES